MSQLSILSTLKQYKEFIAIVAAAIGGFVWFEGLVAKQDDLIEVKNDMGNLATTQALTELECQLDQYMNLSQLQIRLLAVSEDIARHEREMEEMRTTLETAENQTTILMINNRIGVIVESRSDIREEQENWNRQIDEITMEISTDVCG